MKKQKELKRQEELKGEEEIKDNEIYYECYHDNKKFSTQKLYIEHFRKEHPNDYPFYCDECQKGFRNENDLYIHYNSKKHKPTFNCSICGKKFATENALNSHYKSKPKKHNIIACKVCGKGFGSNSALENHCKSKNH